MLLNGLKVVELATWIAGPACAGLMADWGADVIKIETAGGDPVRTMVPDADGRASAIFAMENRGKRSVVLNLGQPAERDALIALLQQADVFITNLRPGSLVRAGLDHASIEKIAPRLIYTSISGQGLSGADADRAAFDITGYWTRSGIAAATIPPDTRPFPCRPGFGDHVTALAALSGTLAALHERAVSGRGRLVEASLLRAASYTLGWDYSLLLRHGVVETAAPRDQWPSPVAGYFRTADERWVYIAPRGPNCLGNALGLIGRRDLAEDPGILAFPPDLDRVREVRAMMDDWFIARSLDQAEAALGETDLIWAPMATPDEVVAAEQAQAAGCFVDLADGGRTPAPPVGLGPLDPRPEPPQLGEHTRSVLDAISAGWPARA